jgi:hypothetical protein
MILGAAGYLSSCYDMESSYKDYVVPNGIVYPQKADSLKVYPGKNRVLLEWLRGIDPRVVSATVYWNNYTDSVVVDVTVYQDTVRYIIDNLNEYTYTFYIKTRDAAGNVSIQTEATGEAYGDIYLSSLVNRPTNKIYLENGLLTVDWNNNLLQEDEIGCELEYTNTEDVMIKQSIPFGELTTLIDDFKSGLKINSVFLPPLSIDTFRIEPSRPKIMEKKFHHRIISGLNISDQYGYIITDHGNYIELTTTVGMVGIYTYGLTEDVRLAADVFFNIEYQADREIGDFNIYYGTPDAFAGGNINRLQLKQTGLDATDESKWEIFQLNCADAISEFNWGVVGHRMRVDFVYWTDGAKIYTRKIWFDVYEYQEVD